MYMQKLVVLRLLSRMFLHVTLSFSTESFDFEQIAIATSDRTASSNIRDVFSIFSVHANRIGALRCDQQIA